MPTNKGEKKRSLSRAETLENSTMLYSLLCLQWHVCIYKRKRRMAVAQEVEGLFSNWKVAGSMPCTSKYPLARHQTLTWQ